MTALDDHLLPGVSFDLNGETLPARELAWAMYAACGCVGALYMMTVDTMTESQAWARMSGNVKMIKRDRDRGFTIKMVKHKDIPFDDCTHSPKWGYMPPPIPPGHSWAVSSSGRVQHLVPLTATGKAEDGKEPDREWVEDDGTWRTKTTSLCGKTTESLSVWSRMWYRTDGKVECAHCVKLAESQVLI